MSHCRMFPSSSPVKIILPSGEKHTLVFPMSEWKTQRIPLSFLCVVAGEDDASSSPGVAEEEEEEEEEVGDEYAMRMSHKETEPLSDEPATAIPLGENTA